MDNKNIDVCMQLPFTCELLNPSIFYNAKIFIFIESTLSFPMTNINVT